MSEETLQEKYTMAKRMDEAYADMFEHVKNYYGPYELFKKCGMTYQDILTIKEQYETVLYKELHILLMSTMLENETGEEVDVTSLLEYLEIPVKNERILIGKVLKNTLPIAHCQTLLEYFRNKCHESLPY